MTHLLMKGHIRPSSSPCGRLVVVVPNKDGTYRMCIDYQDLNKISVKNRYALPRKFIDSLKGAKFFMKLDLKLGYHEIPIDSTDLLKMTFNTKEGLFEWLVMSFGLTNKP